MERENSQPSNPEQAAGNVTQLSEERYRDLVEGINHGIVWEADAALQFSMVSRHAEQILGYPLSRGTQSRTSGSTTYIQMTANR